MSSSRGNSNRQRPQKYQNKSVFKNTLHDTSVKTKFINSIEVKGVCKRCKDIIDWKIKYKKYKPLTAPKKCVGCESKSVKFAYHVMCSECSYKKVICAKCCKPFDEEESQCLQKPDQNNQLSDMENLLKNLSERKRRTILRHVSKLQNGDNGECSDLSSILAKIEDFNIDDDIEFSNDETDSEDEITK